MQSKEHTGIYKAIPSHKVLSFEEGRRLLDEVLHRKEHTAHTPAFLMTKVRLAPQRNSSRGRTCILNSGKRMGEHTEARTAQQAGLTPKGCMQSLGNKRGVAGVSRDKKAGVGSYNASHATQSSDSVLAEAVTS